MLADVTDIAEGEDVGAELLLQLQIELLDKSGAEVGSFSHKPETGDRGQIRELR